MGAGVLACCSVAPELADPNSPEVRADAQRIATLLRGDLAGSPEPAGLYAHSDCSVTILRIAGETSWAQADCTWPADVNDGVEGAWSGPIRVDGDRVNFPEDGSGYPASIERMFPADLAAYVLDHG